jgi:hypothetical protein
MNAFTTHGRLLKCGATIDEIMETLKIWCGWWRIDHLYNSGLQDALVESTAGSSLSQEEKLKRMKPMDKIDSKE